jgi:hypothetical protein
MVMSSTFAPGISPEVVEAVFLFKINAWDEAIHAAVVVGEITIEFMDKVEDRAEVAVNTSAVATMKVMSTEVLSTER